MGLHEHVQGHPWLRVGEDLQLWNEGFTERLNEPEGSLDKIVDCLRGIKTRDIHRLFPWETEDNAMRDYVNNTCNQTEL